MIGPSCASHSTNAFSLIPLFLHVQWRVIVVDVYVSVSVYPDRITVSVLPVGMLMSHIKDCYYFSLLVVYLQHSLDCMSRLMGTAFNTPLLLVHKINYLIIVLDHKLII